MRKFVNKVAVITGAASGIGRGFAEKAVQEGMFVVLADIEKKALEQTVADLRSRKGDVFAVQTDVSKESDIKKLARKTIEKYGAVHLLFNNAGVEVRGNVWEQTLDDWRWILNVNLWSVINGIRVFVPIMLKQQDNSHIVNTASAAGLRSGPGLGSYRVTKSGVIALSETLYHELKLQNAKIGVSVLYPSFVRSRLIEAERNRPAELGKLKKKTILSDYDKKLIRLFKEKNQTAMLPSEFAEMVFKGIRQQTFYIQTHPEINQWIKKRMDEILQSKNPTPPDF